MATAVVNTLEGLDRELETVLTSFDTSYAWNYGSVKDGLRDLYEKSKREQWNGTTQLAWQTDVDPEAEIVPAVINPLRDYPPFQKLDAKELAHARHGAALAPALPVPARRAGRDDRGVAAGRRRAVDRGEVLRELADDGRGAPRRGVQPLRAREDGMGVADHRVAQGAARRHDPRQPLGLQIPRHADPDRGPRDGGVRQPVPDRAGAAAQGAAQVRDARRVAPRRVRRALAARLLRRHARRASSPTARTSSSTPPS